MLPRESLPRHTVSECVRVIRTRLTEMPHEERNIGPEDLLTLLSQVPDQPAVEGDIVIELHTLSKFSQLIC